MSTVKVAEDRGKKETIISARLDDVEAGRWDQVVERVQKRNKLAKVSDILRDLLFGHLALVREEDRAILRGEEPKNIKVRVFEANVAEDVKPYSATKKKSGK